MNTAIQCIILLSCTTICISKVIPKCQCVKLTAAVQPLDIRDVKVYEPRPYCNKKEVILIMKDKSSRCLDLKGLFAKKLLPILLEQIALRAERKRTSNLKTTTAFAPASAAGAQTSSK